MFTDKKLTITSLAVFDISFQKKKPIHVPSRQFHGLTFRKSGIVTVETNNKQIITKQGDITFIPKGISYNTEIIESGTAFAIHFTTLEEYDDLIQQVVSPVNEKTLYNRFSELYSRYRIGRENDLACMSILYDILHIVKTEYNKSTYNSFIDPRIRNAKKNIECNFSDPCLSVSMLAQNANMSEVHFRKLFSKSYGMSPITFIKNTRIENSKALLRSGYYSISDTATRCGFDSISYFSYEFRRIVGISPKSYKENFL